MNELPLIDISEEKIVSLAKETQYAPNGGCYEIENTKRRNMGDFADFEENRLAFG